MVLLENTGSRQFVASAVLLIGTVGTILAVLGFQHIGGYIPCKLCFEQREPFYVAIPLAFLATLSAWRIWSACLTRGLLMVLGLLMLYSVLLAVRHAGVEWAWWEGPGDCGAVDGGMTTDAGSLLEQMQTTVGPACNEAAGRFLGLSFAGWNAVVSAILAVVAIFAAFKSGEKT